MELPWNGPGSRWIWPFVSVLLDAGAGAAWTYVEPESGKAFQRSEGLAIASFHSFYAGLFSSQAESTLES